jgi:KDO2-lipid IV(A) lauroyltransferase
MKYRAKHIVEYAALRAVAALLCILPHRGALAIGWLVAGFAFSVLRFRRRTAEARIRQVLGSDLPVGRVRRIAWLSLRNVVFNAVEMARVGQATRAWLEQVSDCEAAMAAFKSLTDGGRGFVIATPHMGNWELAAITTHLWGVPVFSIAATQRNPLVNRYLNRLRSAPGIETVERGSGAMRAVIRKLKAGGVLAILPDVRVRDEGVVVPFLGSQANLGKGMALFARHVGAPIVPCLVSRRGWTRHRIEALPPIWPDPATDREADVRRMTEAVMAIVEAAIRRTPEQWFWFNKRWVLDPLLTDRKEDTPC